MAGDDEDDCDVQTTDESRRHYLTNDVLAGWLILTFPGIVAAGASGIYGFDLGVVPQSIRLAYVGVVGTATVWAFGKEALEAWRDAGNDR